jgi:aspartyl protease family protein
LGLLAGLTALFQAAQKSNGGQFETITDSGRVAIVLDRDQSGHYLVMGEVNGQAVPFLVDTGATDVALPENAARTLGLDFGPEIMVMTAAGPVMAWRTRLDRVAIGSLSLSNVRATITRSQMSEALLGMSFLKHFSIRQEGDQLIIEGGNSG